MILKLSSVRKRGRPSLNGNATSSPDYPAQRAFPAGQRTIPDNRHPRRSREHATVDEQFYGNDHDETVDNEATEANSEPVDEIIAFDLSKTMRKDEADEQIEDEPEHSASRERCRSPSKDVVETQDNEPTDDSIGVNQNSKLAQANRQSETCLTRLNSNSAAAEPNTSLRGSLQLPSRSARDTPQSTVHCSEYTTAAFAPKTSRGSQSSMQTVQQLSNQPPSSAWTPQALYSHSASSQPSMPRPIALKRPARSSSGSTFISCNQTAANSSEFRTAPSAKRHKTMDDQSQLFQMSGSLDWNALLVRMIPQPSLLCHNLTTLQPSGNGFKESLKAASTALAPHIKSFEQLLTSISDEHRRLTIFERSLFSKKDELAKDLKKAQEALEDVEKTTATENKMLRDLEDVLNKYPRDNELRTFLDKRKKTIVEHQEVYTIVKSQLDNRSAGLSETENEIALVTKRLGQLEAARAEVVKEKEGVDKAAKRLIFMSRFMEPGWQATLDMLEQVFGDEALRTAFCVTTSLRVPHKSHQSA
ncbi:DeSI-like protein sdu1 [Fusarium oxysporum f. sp. albedinis]|nr:DeSI-like protein sdu1 [Fusarium oxysporum f. sp. albedinis]